MPQPMDYIVAFWILTVGTIIGSGVFVVAVIAGVSKLRAMWKQGENS